MSQRPCKICGKLFFTGRQERYCSNACRKEARKSVRKNWENKNPDYMRQYMRERRSGNGQRPEKGKSTSATESKKCRMCGEPVKAEAVYCSPACRLNGRQ